MAAEGGGLNGAGPASEYSAIASDALLAALPTPVLVVDADGILRDGNNAAETLLNLSRHAFVGLSFDDAFGHLLRSADEAAYVAYDVALTLPGGRHSRVDLAAAPIAGCQGLRVVALHPQEAAAPIGRHAGRGRGGRSAAGAAALLAHEIKNPLSGIRGAAQLLEARADDESRALTRLIRDEVDRVATLIDRMEGFTDTRPPDLSPQNIHVILDHARTLALQGFGRDARIGQAYDPSLPPVLGSRDGLVQVLLNLLGNAVEAIEASGRVTISTAYRPGLRVVTADGTGHRALPIEVCVIDDGPGAPAEIAPHLFQPFVTSKRDGRGLGLAIVEKLVTDMGGLVEYARETRDGVERTVFRLLLARAEAG